jgi:hypothetical protein
MSTTTPPDSLVVLDAPQQAPLPPDTLARNLAALREIDAAFAERIAATERPDSWRPVDGLDGYLTWRLEADGAPPRWLGDTAAPRTRARALLRSIAPEKSVALPTIETGAALHDLLERLPPHLAVYVFEADGRVLAAVLAAHDFSAAIADFRCIFVPHSGALESLRALLTANPGLLPPAEILLSEFVTPERLAAVRTIGEQINREVNPARTAQLRELVAAPAVTPEPLPDAPSIALVARTAGADARRFAADLHAAATDLGWSSVLCSLDSPRDAYPLVHARQVAAHRPQLAIGLAHSPGGLPCPPDTHQVVWALDEDALPAGLHDPDAPVALAASPAVADALRAAGVSDARILDCYWAVAEHEIASEPAPAAGPLVLIGDLPDIRPECWGIQQSTRISLWTHLIRTVAECWEQPVVGQPLQVLTRAERAAHLRLADEAEQARFVRLIRRVLVPGIVLENIAHHLSRAHDRIRLIGRGWSRLELASAEILGPELLALPDAGRALDPAAVVLAGAQDALHPTLLAAAARGWPLLLHDLGRHRLHTALGGVLLPQQHFEPFADRAGLNRSLQSLRDAPESGRQRASRARQHLATHHICARRLQDLVRQLQQRSASGSR